MRLLVDSNVLIGAEKGSRVCQRVLEAGLLEDVSLETPPEVAEEVKFPHSLPPGVAVWSPPPTPTAALNVQALQSRIHKEYGGGGGSRTAPSQADRSLIAAAARDKGITGIVSDDSDLEHLYYNVLTSEQRERVTLWTSRECAERLSLR